jgi:signal transduction histidine kinase
MLPVVGSSARTAALAAAAGLLSVVLTAAVVGADLALVSGGSHAQIALDSVAATIGLLLGYLVYGRFQRSRTRQDALLCAGLLTLGGANAVLGVLPVVLGGSDRLSSASAVAGLAAGGCFALAAWAPPVVARRARHAMPFVVAATVLGVALAVGALLPRAGVGSADTVGASPDALLSSAQAVAAGAFLLAAAGWCRPSAQGDTIARSLAVAAVFGAFSRVDFAISSSADASWVTAATLLRVAFYLTLLVSSVVEIRGYWRKVAEAAVLEERRRIARNLHDGLAQELAFTATQARALGEGSVHPSRARLVAAAAERALDESRRAIAALTRPLDEPLEVALAQCAEEVCGRFEARLELDLASDLAVDGDVREALLRILREAVANAVRHGQATSVVVRLRGPSPIRLEVKDDGHGFDPTDLRHLSGRFGLVSMRERAEGLGGTFTLWSSPQQGTTVEVVLP